MNIQHPYYLYSQAPQAEGSRNDEGDFVENQTPAWMLIGSCRDEINSKGNVVAKVNGENIHVQATIYAPKNTQLLPIGTRVLVTKEKIGNLNLLSDSTFIEEGLSEGKIRLNDVVKGCSQTRLNLRIWV